MPLSSCKVNLGQSLALGLVVFSQRVPRDLPKAAHLFSEWGITARKDQILESLDLASFPSFLETPPHPRLSIFSSIKENQVTVHAFPGLSLCSHYFVILLRSHESPQIHTVTEYSSRDKTWFPTACESLK